MSSYAAKFWGPAPEPPTELGRYRIMGPNAAVRISPLCLGGMNIGEAWAEGIGFMTKEQSFELLDAYVEAGGNFIDTANNYQDEESEQWIGEWMQARQNRDRIVLATKFTSDYRSWLVGKGTGPNYAGNHRKSLHMSVRESLRKLQTDYVDVLYMHWWDHTTSVKELMDSLHYLVEQGKVLYLGASDCPAWVVSAANTYAVEQGKTPFAVYQGRWSLMQRDLERDVIPMCRAFGMAIAPWDVLGGGKFQSRKALEERRARGEGLRAFVDGPPGQTPEEERVSEALYKVAREHGTESVTAVALAYVLSKVANVYPIVGGRRVDHLRDNITALSINLTDEQVKFLEGASRYHVGFPQDFIGEDPSVTGFSNRLVRNAQFAWPHLRK